MRNVLDLINDLFRNTHHSNPKEKQEDLRRWDLHKSQGYIAARDVSFRR